MGWSSNMVAFNFSLLLKMPIHWFIFLVPERDVTRRCWAPVGGEGSERSKTECITAVFIIFQSIFFYHYQYIILVSSWQVSQVPSWLLKFILDHSKTNNFEIAVLLGAGFHVCKLQQALSTDGLPQNYHHFHSLSR